VSSMSSKTPSILIRIKSFLGLCSSTHSICCLPTDTVSRDMWRLMLLSMRVNLISIRLRIWEINNCRWAKIRLLQCSLSCQAVTGKEFGLVCSSFSSCCSSVSLLSSSTNCIRRRISKKLTSIISCTISRKMSQSPRLKWLIQRREFSRDLVSC